jgi:hypothetical protein
MTGSYLAEEIYVNAQFAGHRGIVSILDGDSRPTVRFINAERIAEQWTPLAEQYQMESVHRYHPLDNNNYGKYMMAGQYEYNLVLKNLRRLSEPINVGDVFHVASLGWPVKLIMHENDLYDHFHVTFEILLGWTFYEEPGRAYANQDAMSRVNFTP